MNINQSKTCVHCGKEINDEDMIHLGRNSCFELELLSDKDYGEEAKFHTDCFYKLTQRLTVEGRMLILMADEGMTAADILPLQDEIS